MSYYQDLLKLMGINFATEMVKQDKPNEVKLWRAVINNALGDVTLNLSDRKSSIQKMTAHDWIMQNSEDFQQVCYYADLEPSNIRLQYIRAIKKGKIIFTDRQVKWKKYYDNFQILKYEKDKEERKRLRKIVEYLRRLVSNSSNKSIKIIY
jgi:predicted nucleotidyltransferase component of viral defense system